MTTQPDQSQGTLADLLDLFDVEPDGDRFVGQTGLAGAGERQVVEGTQVLSQAIVAVAKRFPEKSIRSATWCTTRRTRITAWIAGRRGGDCA